VLVVEDDESHVLALTVGLERERLAVTVLRDGHDVLDVANRLRPDVILLDVMLPGASGIEVCRELRTRGFEMPIIFVSARSEELDIVVGIEVGADDYVAKPYRMRELIARIGALLRRQRVAQFSPAMASTQRLPDSEMIKVGDVVLDAERHEVFVRDTEIDFPLREFQVLRELLQNAGRVVTRETLLERVWGLDYDGDPRIVATLIGRLRARIEEDPDNPVHILTIRGVGYRFNDRV
jgi:two-component system response regulator RegX3